MNAPKASITAACASSLVLLAAAVAAQAAEHVVMAGSHRVEPGDNLLDLARAHDLGYVEMLTANPGVDPWLPAAGAELRLPTAHLPPPGLEQAPVVVNLAELRLYWRTPDGAVHSAPAGVGREGFAAHPGMTRVAAKREAPTWVPPASVRAEKPWLPASVPPGPDNPLGDYSLDLADGLLRIHGTNLPDGVGRRVSHGCFRLYPEDIARLYPAVPVGAAVLIVNEAVKLAQVDGEWWLEIHPGQEQANAIEARQKAAQARPPDLEARISAQLGADLARVDWQAVAWAARERWGTPVRITIAPAAPPLSLLQPP